MRFLVTLLWWAIMTPLGALWAFPWTFITGRVDALYWYAMWVARTGVRISGITWEITGLKELNRSRPYIFMSNHVSVLDPPLLLPLLPRRATVMVKKELFRIPVLGRAMLMADLVAIDRSNRDAAIASVRAAGQVLRKGLDMLVFPEGTRSPDGRLLPFKQGPFHLAVETGTWIVPVTILGTETLLPKGSSRTRPGKAKIVFHSPVNPADYPRRDELIAVVREQIASVLPEGQQ